MLYFVMTRALGVLADADMVSCGAAHTMSMMTLAVQLANDIGNPVSFAAVNLISKSGDVLQFCMNFTVPSIEWSYAES
jgi:hypothetical protein